MRTKDTIYTQVVSITHEYLGPAADRFVSRQVQNHLSITPELLQKKDVAKLIEWFGLSMAHLSEDTKLVKRYVAALTELSQSNGK